MEKQKKTNTFLMILYGIIALLVVIFIIQNRMPIEINLLGLKLAGRSFIVFVVIFGLGFFSGWLFEYLRHNRKPSKEKGEQKSVRYSEE